MAGEPGLTELVTTTLRNRSKKIYDGVSNSIALLNKMQETGTFERVPGGRTIVESAEGQNNSSYKRYEGSDVLNTASGWVITAAEYSPKQVAVAYGINGLEQNQNSGDAAVYSLVKERAMVAERTLKNGINTDLTSDGTASGGKQIGGLKLLVSKTPTVGSVGGIDRSTTAGAFMRNYKFDTVNDGGAVASAANIEAYMRKCFNNTYRDGDAVNIILFGNNYYEFYEEAVASRQRITDAKLGALGFDNVKFKGVPVVLAGGYQAGTFDGVTGTGIGATDGYFLNTNYIKFKVYQGRDFVPLEKRFSVNQDAEINYLVFMGNMTMSVGFPHAVLFDS